MPHRVQKSHPLDLATFLAGPPAHAELAQALSIADAAIIRRRDDLDWDPSELTPLTDAAKITVCDSVLEIVDTVCDIAEPGDQIVMMSNGSFDGLRELLGARLN